MNPLERLQRIGDVILALAFKVGRVGLFGRGVIAKRNDFLVDLDNSAPFAVVVVGSKQAAAAFDMRPLLVLHVGAASGHAQVAKPVVIAGPVDMVDFAIRPDTVGVKPNQSVGCVGFAKNLAAPVPQATWKAKRLAGHHAHGRAYAPDQRTGFRVVVQKLLDKSLSQARLLGSHAVVLQKRWFGERPEAVCSSFGPRYFSMRIA